MSCKRCGAKGPTLHSLSLIDADPDSSEEGLHLADVDVWLCAECVGDVADLLLEFVNGLTTG